MRCVYTAGLPVLSGRATADLLILGEIAGVARIDRPLLHDTDNSGYVHVPDGRLASASHVGGQVWLCGWCKWLVVGTGISCTRTPRPFFFLALFLLLTTVFLHIQHQHRAIRRSARGACPGAKIPTPRPSLTPNRPPDRQDRLSAISKSRLAAELTPAIGRRRRTSGRPLAMPLAIPSRSPVRRSTHQ